MVDQPSTGPAATAHAPAPSITVVGVGGAGGNAINNMIRANLEGVQFVVANTDAQALKQSMCENQIQLGANVTQGLGAGAQPEIGQAATEESIEAIVSALKGSNMAFITAGMGGGTGTGGAPVIARAAREEGVLTVGVVTKPFDFEGAYRMRQAEAGITELSQCVDTLIVIPNQNLFLVADDNTTFADAFKLADDVLHSGVRGVTDLMILPGLVNLDFADVRSIMAGMGKAVMGTGEAEGANRALTAAEAAISNPLLDEVTMKGARSVLINITGGLDLMLMEVDEAANRIRNEVDPDANIIFGSVLNENLDGKIRVSVIATGNDTELKDQSTAQSNRPFILDHAENRDVKPVVEIDADGIVEQVATSKKPARSDEQVTVIEAAEGSDADGSDADGSDADGSDAHGSDEGVVRSSVDPATDKPATFSLVGSIPVTLDLDHAAAAGDGPGKLATASKPEARTSPKRRGTTQIKPAPRLSSLPTLKWEEKPKFQRPAKPVKSKSTLEAFESNRRLEETTEAAAEKMHYVVWEVELGARIYKVPDGKLASVQTQPHADKLKLFDNLENAKVEANAIFKRVAAERIAKGLPRSILEPTLKDILRWDEKNVPSYFL